MYKLSFSKNAIHLFKEAHLYYLCIDNKLGIKFLAEINKYFELIKTNPQNYSYLKEDKLKKARIVTLKTFPYSIIYEVMEKEILIYTIHNTHQHPKNKLRK